jgi:hypothetical protein
MGHEPTERFGIGFLRFAMEDRYNVADCQLAARFA